MRGCHSTLLISDIPASLLALVMILIMTLAIPAATAAEPAAEQTTPKLVVVVAVDQLRKDRLTAQLQGGLGRLLREGRNFVDSSLDHGVTNTCPGHAVIMTGVQPSKAGVAGNDFVDGETWETRYCVADDSADALTINGQVGRSPRLLKVDALGDWLKAEHSGARVFAVSGKDRAAVTMGGQQPDAVFWYETKTRQFTSSRYYLPALPDYLDKFNGVDGFMTAVPTHWVHATGTFRADDYPGESTKYQSTSGHPLNMGNLKERGEQIFASPFLDMATMALARTIIEQEQLGQDSVPDLLAIGLSSTDSVGHLYGPFSAEAEDTLSRVDQILGEFLDYLDERVGKNKYLLVLTADHGVADLPEWRVENQLQQCPNATGRLDFYTFMASLFGTIYWRETFPFDLPTDLVKIAGNQVYINRNYLAARQLDLGRVEADLKRQFEAIDIVKQAWTQAEIMAGTTATARLLRNSLVPGRSGDLMLQVYSDCVIRSDGTGTTHGTVYDYDRAIPLVFLGAGVAPGTVTGAAHSVDIAPTLATAMGLIVPADLDGKPLSLLQPATDRIIQTNHQ